MSLVLTLVPLLTVGQTITLRITDQVDVVVTPASCNLKLPGTWNTTFGAGVCSAMQLWVTQGECGDLPRSDDLQLTDVPTVDIINRTNTGPVLIPVANLPFFKNNVADGGAQCGAPNIEVDHKFCAAVSADTIQGTCFSKQIVHATVPVTIHYDTLPPGQPSLTAEPLDSSAALSISVDSDTDTVEVQYRVAGSGDGGTDDFVHADTVASSGFNTTLEGLENGVTYDVRVVAFDAANNASTPSEIVTVTPVMSTGFWGACREAGCTTGCAAAAGPLSLAVLASLLLLRRYRR